MEQSKIWRGGQLCHIEAELHDHLLSFFSLSFVWIVVTAKALTKSTQTIVPTRREVVREAPLPVEGAVAGVLVLVVVLAILLSVGARHSGAQIPAVSVVVVETV